MTEDRMLSPTEAAAMLGVHKSTIYRWIENRWIEEQHIKRWPNGRIFISADRLNDFRGFDDDAV